ncbi:hypothetical protein MHH96_21040 [Niallia sp. FSL K6-0212]|uniref:hypothetical protein n=1 Tax=Niallia sp. FSL K6-0212 TaxID=2921423 RepID=UPI0030FCA74C
MALSKNEVEYIIAKHLESNPKTQIAAIRNVVEDKLREQGVIGKQSIGNQYYTKTWEERISNKDALLINEVFYDFLYGRIITPGIDSLNNDFPWVHVSDPEKLKKYL